MSKNNNLIFNFEEKQTRIVVINNEPFFCASDVCKILEYKNGRDAVKDNCKKDGVATSYITDSLGRQQEATFINEPNLYRLIMKSRMPKAVAFQDWVVEKVLPEIRKTGKYEVQKKELSRKELALMIIEVEEEKEKLLLENIQQQEVIEKYIAIDNNKNFTEVAKILKISPSKFIYALKIGKYIRENREPYQKYLDNNLFTIKKTIREYKSGIKHYESYLITPKGFEYFREKVKELKITK